MSRTRIVVTGGAGRIGSYVVAELQDDYDVTVFDRVLPSSRYRAHYRVGDHEDLGQLCQACAGAAAVLHLSAIPAPRTYPDSDVFRTNVVGTFNAHQAATMLGISTVVSTSSQAAYGWGWGEHDFLPRYLPLDEDHPDEPDDAYGLSKVVGEKIAQTFHRKSGMHTIVLRPPLVIFPGSYCAIRERAETPTSWRSALLTYVDARDLARAYRAALERTDVTHGVFNVAAADSLAATPLATVLPRLDPRLLALANSLTGHEPMVSNQRIKNVLGCRPRHSWRTESE